MNTSNARDAGESPTGPYRLTRPDLAEAHAALQRLYRSETAAVWERLLRSARLTGRETDEQAFERLLAAMLAADPVTSLCGRGLAIRLDTYQHLAAAHTLIRSAE
jgi:hypothetical protein